MSTGITGQALTPVLAAVGARWQALSERDRRALSIMATVVGLAAAWWLLLAPLQSAAQRAVDRHADEASALAWMQANAGLARQGAASGAGQLPPGQSMLAAVNASARGAGLDLQRFEPEGDLRVRISLEKAVFTDVMAWLADLERRYGIQVANLTADAQGDPGRVNLRLTLERAAP